MLLTLIFNCPELSYPFQTLESLTGSRWFRTGISLIKNFISEDNLRSPDQPEEERKNTPVLEGRRGSPEGAEKTEPNKSTPVPAISDNITDTSVDTEDKMANKDDWRTRGGFRDEGGRDYYDPRYGYNDPRDGYNDPRDGYDHRRGYDRSSKRNRSGRDKNRPSSSHLDYRNKRDGYGSDNSTCSEPAANDRNHQTNSGKPFSKESGKYARKSVDGTAEETTADIRQQNSPKPKSESQKPQTLSKGEKGVNPKQDKPDSKTDSNPKRSEPVAKNSQTKPPAPPTYPPNTNSPSTHIQEKQNKTTDSKSNVLTKPKASIPPAQGGNKSTDAKTNTLPKTDTSIPLALGRNNSSDNTAITPPGQGVNIQQKEENKPSDYKTNIPPKTETSVPQKEGHKPSDKKVINSPKQETIIPPKEGGSIQLKPGTKIPLAQGENKSSENKAPTQGESTPPKQEANIPAAKVGNKSAATIAIPPNQGTIIPVAQAGNNQSKQQENKPGQSTIPITSKPIISQTQNSFPNSNKETINQSDQIATTQNTQPLQAPVPFPFGSTLQENSASPITGPNPFQPANSFPFNSSIPGPVMSQPFLNKQETGIQRNSQETSPPNQSIVGIGGKPTDTPPTNPATLRHPPPTIDTKSDEDITEANNNQYSFNTRPSTEHIIPEPGANGATFSHPSSQDIVPQSSVNPPTNMSDKEPPKHLEQIKQLKSELEIQRNRINEAEEKAGLLQKEKENLQGDITEIQHELKQKKEEITVKDKENLKVSNELRTEKHKATGIESEKQKTSNELKASKKECEGLRTEVKQYLVEEANNKSSTQNLDKDIAELETKLKNNSKELEAKQKELTKLKESHSIEIKNLKKTMEDSKAGAADAVNEQKKILGANESNLKQLQEDLKSTQAEITKAESKHKDSAQEIIELKQQIVQLTNEDSKLKETISQLHAEKDQFEAGMNSYVDIDLLTKIEEVFICLSNQEPPHEYTPGSPDRVEWLVSSLTSWNAQLTEKISTTESLLYEKETEIDAHKAELQSILNFLQQHKPTNKSSTASSTSSPLKLIQTILSERTDQLSKAHLSRVELERYNKTMEVQIGETRQHYKDESKKNDQLMQDNADLERRVQRLTSEKDELEIKNVELINELSATRSDYDNLNEPSLQLQDANATLVQELLNPRPSPLPLGMMSPFPFEAPPLPSPNAFSLTQGHRSTLQKAADELSHLKVKVWESEAENSKLREQLSSRNKDPSLPASVSPDAESAFQAVFEANQSNLMKLAESNREKDLFSRDVEFLRQRVEELEKNVDRLKVSIEVKEVAYKELYLECREWERKYKKCGHVHQELDRVKRQLMRREAETQECATLRAERLNQQTTLDNLVAELQERKKAEQILTRENQKLHARLEETLQHISNMQSRIQEHTITELNRNPKPEEIQQPPVPHPASPTILKPPSMTSVPLSPPTRQPATKRHPPILYPPTSS